MTKHEFAGAGWVAEMRRIVGDLLRPHDLTGIEYAFCEEFTDPPDHLRRDGAPTIGWHLRIAGGRVEVGDTPIDDVDFKIVADYQAVLPLARAVFAGHPDPAGLKRLLDDTVAAGKIRQEGDRSRAPGFFASLDLHDPIARLTK